ncbi:MAG TPA: nuclear transport factor 2 family protein [Acidimicrobiales bacterium]
MDLAELIARESVRDLVARYNANADTGRFDQAVELFAPDAVLEIGEARHEGRDGIRALFSGTRDTVAAHSGDAPRYVRHYTATLQIDVTSATTARSRCYFAVLLAHGLDHWGRYVDEFAEIEGRWQFTHRRVTVDGRAEGSAFATTPERR